MRHDVGLIGLLPNHLNHTLQICGPRSRNRGVVASFRSASTQPARPSVVMVGTRQKGGAQSRLVLCDDGKLYVLKMHPNPQGPNVLANEALGVILLSGLGLQVPLWRPLTINLKTVPLFPELTMETAEEVRFPACGVHFGSEFLGNSEVDLYDFIPDSYQQEVRNAGQFAAIELFDLWAIHRDHRQCVYQRTKGTGAYEAFFIDNGHLFGGPSWSEVDYQHRSGWSLNGQAPKLEGESTERWVTLFESRIPTLLREAVALVPQEWCENDIKDVCTRLILRLGTLRAMVDRGLGR